MVGNDKLEHGISEKLESLVVEMECFAFKRKTRVGQCFGQQERVAELVTDPALERIHVRRQIGGVEIGQISRLVHGSA